VQLDSGLGNPLFGEEGRNLEALVTLELDHLTHLFVFDEGAVASKLLLEGFQEFLEIVLFGQALEGGQGFPSIALLNANVDVILLRPNVLVSKGVAFISEGIVGSKVLNAHTTRERKDARRRGAQGHYQIARVLDVFISLQVAIAASPSLPAYIVTLYTYRTD